MLILLSTLKPERPSLGGYLLPHSCSLFALRPETCVTHLQRKIVKYLGKKLSLQHKFLLSKGKKAWLRVTRGLLSALTAASASRPASPRLVLSVAILRGTSTREALPRPVSVVEHSRIKLVVVINATQINGEYRYSRSNSGPTLLVRI